VAHTHTHHRPYCKQRTVYVVAVVVSSAGYTLYTVISIQYHDTNNYVLLSRALKVHATRPLGPQVLQKETKSSLISNAPLQTTHCVWLYEHMCKQRGLVSFPGYSHPGGNKVRLILTVYCARGRTMLKTGGLCTNQICLSWSPLGLVFWSL